MKVIIKDISIYSLGEIFTKGLGFFSIVFYTHILTKEEIGLYGYITVIIFFVTTVVTLGLDNAYARYFFEYKEKFEKQTLTTTLIFFLILWGFIIIAFILFFIEDISNFFLEDKKYELTLSLAFSSVILKVISSITNQALRNQFRTKLFIFINFINALINFVLSIIFLLCTNLKIAGIFLATIVGDLLILIVRMYFIRDLLIKNLDFHILYKLLIFGIPFLPTSIAYWIFSSADRIMLEKMVGLEYVAIYTIALSFTSIMTILSTAIGQAWSPHIVNIYEEERSQFIVVCNKFLKFLLMGSIFIVFIISMLGKEFILIVFPENYSNAFYPTLFLLIGATFNLTTQVTAIGISISKKTFYFIYITLFVALFNIILNYFLIPKYTVIGAAFANMFSYCILTFIYALITQKLTELKFQYKLLVISILLICIIIFASLLPLILRLLLLIIGLIFFSLIQKKFFKR